MRTLTQPPPKLRCDLCGGELRLKLVEPADPFEKENEIFVCADCGHEHLCKVVHNHYSPHRSNVATKRWGRFLR
jgi:rRNA maturation endonuclease Nob1